MFQLHKEELGPFFDLSGELIVWQGSLTLLMDRLQTAISSGLELTHYGGSDLKSCVEGHIKTLSQDIDNLRDTIVKHGGLEI